MRSGSRRYLWLLLLLAVTSIIFVIFRRSARASFGPSIALCPGPDRYGYTCENGAAFAYIDATNDALLYADDGITPLPLPFPFTFYGTTYTEVQVSSNGNIQFGNANAWFGNECMTTGPVAHMGDMIAPFWDDLDLRFFGFLEYETVGAAPDRIFVIEWDDVPRFGENSEDRVTFEVQLFETSDDVVFLYEDVDTLEGYNGSSATIGVQSEIQRLVLQYSCNQPKVANASGIYFPHPEPPNGEIGQEVVVFNEHRLAEGPIAKGAVAELISMVNQWGPTILTRLRSSWLNQHPSRASDWRWIDLTGDGRKELTLVWRSGPDSPGLAQLIVLEFDESGQAHLSLGEALATRQVPTVDLAFVGLMDLTQDGIQDILMAAEASGELFVISAATGKILRHPVPEQCQGPFTILDRDQDGQSEIVRGECESGRRVGFAWNGGAFAKVQIDSDP